MIQPGTYWQVKVDYDGSIVMTEPYKRGEKYVTLDERMAKPLMTVSEIDSMYEAENRTRKKSEK